MAVGDGVIWNETLPDNTTLAHQIDDYDRDLRVGVRSRMAREHVWSSSQTATNEGGHHSFITFQQQTGAPTLSTALTQVGAICVGSSGAGYPLLFVNSAGTSVSLVNSAGIIPVITTGTLGAIPICASGTTNGLTVLAGPTSTTATTFVLTSVNNATGGVTTPVWSSAPALSATNLINSFTSYDSGWFAVGTSGTYVKTHNLGTTKLIMNVYFSADGSTGISEVRNWDAENGYTSGYRIDSITTTSLTVLTAANGVNITAFPNTNAASGYYRVIVIALP